MLNYATTSVAEYSLLYLFYNLCDSESNTVINRKQQLQKRIYNVDDLIYHFSMSR